METSPSVRVVEPILNPTTGELVDLTATTDRLAEWLDAFRELDALSRRAKTAITEELAGRLDHEGMASYSGGGWKLSVNRADSVKWDADAVYKILEAAADAGEISHGAAELACPPTGKRKIAKRDLDRVLSVLPIERADEVRRLAQPETRRVPLSRLQEPAR